MEILSYLLGKKSGGGGGDLSQYFTSTIGAGTSNVGGYINMIKKIPETTIVDGTDMSYAFRGYPATTIPLLDTSNVTTMAGMLRSASNLTTIPLIDTSNVTDFSNMFQYCSSLTTIPLINTSKALNMGQMFSDCTNLTTVPILNTSIVQNGKMTNMFSQCTSLSNESLNNILQMCIDAKKQTTSSNRTLAKIGLSQAQATICMTLSNYEAFTNAGWTTGY